MFNLLIAKEFFEKQMFFWIYSFSDEKFSKRIEALKSFCLELGRVSFLVFITIKILEII